MREDREDRERGRDERREGESEGGRERRREGERKGAEGRRGMK